jgi:transposase
MPVSEEDREVIWKRNLRRKRKAAAERKRTQRAQEKAERARIAKTARQEREDARQRKRQELLENGGKVNASGAVMPVRVNAVGKLVPAVGRPDLRNDKFLVEKLLAALKNGHTLTDAAVFAGTSHKTVHKWLNEGATAEEGTLAKEFYNKVELARAMAVDDCIKSIKGAAKKGAWQAAAWFLERRVPEVYGKKSEVTVSQNKPFEVALVDAAFSEEEMQAALKAVLKKNPELAPVIIDAEVIDVE